MLRGASNLERDLASKVPMRALSLLLLLACGPAPIVLSEGATAPNASSEATEAPTGTTESGAETGASVDPLCDVRIDTAVEPRSDGTFVLRASLTSLVGAREVTLPQRCPSGAATFRGLPEGYDYYGTCNAGACPAPPPLVVTLGPEPILVAEATVDPRPSPCNQALAAGLYLVSAELAIEGVRTCVNRAATLTVP